MNLTQLRLYARKYTAVIAVAIVAIIAAVSFGTIWFLQRSQGPLAPTAPTSRPSAATNVCSVEFVVRNECVGMKVMNAAGTQELVADAAGNFPVGSMADFKLQCEGLQGTTKSSFQVYNEGNKEWNEFELKDHSKDETTKKFSPSTISTEAPPEGPNRRNNGDVVQVRCRPQAGEWTTGLTTVTANCTKKLIVTKTTTGGTCSASCSADTDCTGGRVCSGGMCRNPSCPADADCTCGTTTGGSCSDSCSADTDCTGGRVCSGGMCRNPSCPADADCTCNTTTTPVSCQVAAFTEDFADSTLATKLTKTGPGTLSFSSGLGMFEVIPTQAMGSDQRSSLESNDFITGNFQFRTEVSQYTVGSGSGTVFARLALFAENNVPSYRLDWRKGDNNTSQLVAERTVAGNPVSITGTQSTNVTTDALVSLKAVRTGTTLDMYYQLNNGLNIKFATFTASEALRPVFSLNANDTGRTVRAAVDNLALVCDTTVTNPPQSCSASCNSNDDCVTGLSCNGGMCRNPSCTGEADCTCPTTTGASCNNTCSANADCADGLICNGGSCRNPSCVNQNNCQCTTNVASCNNTCTSNANCQSGLTCSGGVCRNPSCTNQSNCQCQIASGTPTPTPVASCSKSCVTSSDCSNGLTCSSGMCRNANCTADADCSCNMAGGTPTPTPTTQLPQAGSMGQTLALVGIGALVVGLGAARFRFLKK